jgi:DNA repair exonuclease SbcCD nuclease subunit|tara:strand:- start:242 stop:1303 length:1062 start_codon:yes stop_codon:yes gene_type:complete
MKIAILNDTHCGIRNSSQIFLDNAKEFYDKVFFPECEKHNIKQIVHLGDYYDHRKFVNFKALNHNRKCFLNEIRKRGMMMDIIPGNHDTYFKNTNDLNALKELLGHYMNEIHIIMEPTVMEYGSLKMSLLPWINQENHQQSMNFIQNCKADWLGAHLELCGFDMLKGIPNHHGMNPAVVDRFEQVITGHFHTSSKKGNVWYLGSPLEYFWSDAHDPKYFHILDTETRKLERIQNNYRLFEKIVYNATKTNYNTYTVSNLDKKFVKIIVVNKGDSFTFDRFVDRIQNQDIYELKIAENFSEFVGQNIADEGLEVDDTPKLMDDYINNVDTDLDKDKLKINMRDLMTEAQSLEIA